MSGTQGNLHKPQRPSRMSRQQATTRAFAALRNAFTDSGKTPAEAFHLARVLLTRPNVQIGPRGNIKWNGKVYSPTSFTTSRLAQIATGQVAANRNQAAIKGDPGYIQSLAQLALQRDQAQAGISDARRQQLIQFGDPAFAQGDPLTAGAAQVNPYSTVALLAQQDQRNKAAVQAAANRYGTLQGGGYQSGLAEEGRVNQGAYQDAYTKLQSLLASLNSQQAANQQAYGLGESQAGLDAYNRLLASGAIHAAQAPNWRPGFYHYIGQFRHGPPPGATLTQNPPMPPQYGGGPVLPPQQGGGTLNQPPPYGTQYPNPTPPRLT